MIRELLIILGAGKCFFFLVAVGQWVHIYIKWGPANINIFGWQGDNHGSDNSLRLKNREYNMEIYIEIDAHANCKLCDIYI